MRTKAERRKLTWKHIRHNLERCAYSHKGSNTNKALIPHKLYKGLNFKNYSGYAFNTKNLGLSQHDLRDYISYKEQIGVMYD